MILFLLFAVLDMDYILIFRLASIPFFCFLDFFLERGFLMTSAEKLQAVISELKLSKEEFGKRVWLGKARIYAEYREVR